MHTHTPEHTRELTQAAAQAEAAVDFLYIMDYLGPKGKGFLFLYRSVCYCWGKQVSATVFSTLSFFSHHDNVSFLGEALIIDGRVGNVFVRFLIEHLVSYSPAP